MFVVFLFFFFFFVQGDNTFLFFSFFFSIFPTYSIHALNIQNMLYSSLHSCTTFFSCLSWVGMQSPHRNLFWQLLHSCCAGVHWFSTVQWPYFRGKYFFFSFPPPSEFAGAFLSMPTDLAHWVIHDQPLFEKHSPPHLFYISFFIPKS